MRTVPAPFTARCAAAAGLLLGAVVQVLLTSGCTTAPAEDRSFARQVAQAPDRAAYIPDVPDLRPARDDERAAPALANVLTYWSRPVDVRKATALLRSMPKGEPEEALVRAGEQGGLWSFSRRGSMDEVKEKLRNGVPVIALLQDGTDPGDRRFSVLVGYDDVAGQVLAHDGARAPVLRSQADFGRRWLPAGRWYAVVCPARTSLWAFTVSDYVSRAGHLLRSGDPVAAAADYASAILLQPRDFSLRYGHAACLQQTGDDARAIDAYREARRLDPRHFSTLNNLAFLLARSGSALKEAEGIAREALAVAPGHAEALDTLGYVLLHQQRYDEAIATLRQAMGLARTLPAVSRRAIEVHLALAYLGDQNLEMMQKIVDTILAEDPTYTLPAELRPKETPAHAP